MAKNRYQQHRLFVKFRFLHSQLSFFNPLLFWHLFLTSVALSNQASSPVLLEAKRHDSYVARWLLVSSVPSDSSRTSCSSLWSRPGSDLVLEPLSCLWWRLGCRHESAPARLVKWPVDQRFNSIFLDRDLTWRNLSLQRPCTPKNYSALCVGTLTTNTRQIQMFLPF